MSADGPADAIYNPPDGFVESLLHHTAATRAHFPDSAQPGTAQPQEQAPAPAADSPQTTAEPKTRLRKACDSCSARKVKCDETGPPCQSCASLHIPCTFERPSRRRGPPNKYANAVKRQRLGSDGSWSATALSPTEDAAHSLASLSSTQGLSAESICDIVTLRALIDDYFTYVYPLTPLPHEPTFRAAFDRREDRTNRTFLALLASMIESLVASFPRRSYQILSSKPHRRLYPNGNALINRCHRVFNETRGIGYLDRELSLYDASSSYLVALSSAHLFNMNRVELYLGECVSIVRRLAPYQVPTDPAMQSPTNDTTVGEADSINQELGRRLTWLACVNGHSLRQMGDGVCHLPISVLTRKEIPPLPIEIDDGHIHQDRIDPQSPGVPSLITGYNIDVRILRVYTFLCSSEGAFAMECMDWESQKQIIGRMLHGCRALIDSAPQQLQVESLIDERAPYTPPVVQFQVVHQGQQQDPWYDGTTQLNGMDGFERSTQYEIQKANIYASHLETRCTLVEKCWKLSMAHNDPADRLGESSSQLYSNRNGAIDAMFQTVLNFPAMSTHHRDGGEASIHASEQAIALKLENIVRDLAIFLHSLGQTYVEPNRLSFCRKIRHVVSTLLRIFSKHASMPALDLGAVATYLTTTLDIITKLETLHFVWLGGVASSNESSPEKDFVNGVGEADGETREREEWSNLKAFQGRFIKENGIG